MQISVVMPAYNAEKYIAEAINSVLKQSFTNFEFIIVDDGSSDSTLSIIKSYTDSRIILIENKHDYIGSLNKGIQAARGKYIARMDADDVMHVDRLKIQHGIMEEEPGIIVCSAWMELFGDRIKPNRAIGARSGLQSKVLIELIQGNYFIVHAASIIRKDFLNKHQLRYEYYTAAEDYKLWVEIAKLEGQFYIEPQILHYYRQHGTQISGRKNELQQSESNKIKSEIIQWLISQSEDASLLQALQANLLNLQQEAWLTQADSYKLFYQLFSNQFQKNLAKK